MQIIQAEDEVSRRLRNSVYSVLANGQVNRNFTCFVRVESFCLSVTMLTGIACFNTSPQRQQQGDVTVVMFVIVTLFYDNCNLVPCLLGK